MTYIVQQMERMLLLRQDNTASYVWLRLKNLQILIKAVIPLDNLKIYKILSWRYH